VARYLSSVESSLIRLQSADLLKSFKLSYERNTTEEEISLGETISISLNDIIFLLDSLTFLPCEARGEKPKIDDKRLNGRKKVNYVTGENERGGGETMLKMKKKGTHSCRKCRKRFATDSLLAHHQKTAHLGKSHADDDNAGQETLGMQAFTFNEDDMPICCQKCNGAFRKLADFQSHEPCTKELGAIPFDTHLVLDHNRFWCGYCKEQFRQFARVSHHLTALCQVQLLNGENEMICELCHATFSAKKQLVEHKVRVHPNERPFACQICHLKRFKLNSSLQKHIRKAHDPSKKDAASTFKCGLCPKRFLKQIYLTNHRLRFHQLGRDFLCPTCGSAFVTKNSLRLHERTVHDGTAAIFRCDICQSDFRRRDKLRLHVMSVHTGERPHECGVCGRGFVTKSKLDHHHRSVHLGERRFACPVCSKAYATSTDLRKHLTNRKNQKCHLILGGDNIVPNMPLTEQIISKMI